MTERAAIILAAGISSRMKTDTPKVLHEVCGRPMLAYVLDACRGAGVEKIYVVVGFGAPSGELLTVPFAAAAAAAARCAAPDEAVDANVGGAGGGGGGGGAAGAEGAKKLMIAPHASNQRRMVGLGAVIV